jgi:hypothetical protein
MTTLTEGRHTGEHLISEAAGTRSRDVVTLVTGQNLEPGTVLGKITASGKYTQLAPAAADGSEVAAAVLFAAVDATAADKAAVVHLRDTEIASAGLNWSAVITAGEKAVAAAELKALGIVIR